MDRPRQRGRPGVEDKGARPVLVEELARGHGVGGDGGEGVAELCVQLVEPGTVAGDADDVRAVAGEATPVVSTTVGTGDVGEDHGPVLQPPDVGEPEVEPGSVHVLE